jgi:acyl-CoA thioester hydrolase
MAGRHGEALGCWLIFTSARIPAYYEPIMIEYHDVTVRVRYAETDQMGVVYHSNFLIWFEVGRVEIMRSLGFDYKRMEAEDDCYLVVADAHCRYHYPARYDELITVRTRILDAKNRMLKFGYEVLRQTDQKLLATGYTTHISCHRDGRVTHFPEKYKAAFLELVSELPADRSEA